jgi:probable HAF family extracellular repeat protein
MAWIRRFAKILRPLVFAIALGLAVCSLHWLTQVQAQSESTIPENVKTANLTFTTIDVPGAFSTEAQGINSAGEVVGYYTVTEVSPAHAFLFSNGTFSFFDYPGADQTAAYGINDGKGYLPWLVCP